MIHHYSFKPLLSGFVLFASFANSVFTQTAFAESAAIHAFGMNDVSVLLPLPKTAAEDSLLLHASDAGAKGALLPKSPYFQMPSIVSTVSSDDIAKLYLRVIAIRVDPCFVEGTGQLPCRRQVRLIWQPVILGAHGNYTTLDAAMHSFYEFNDSEFQSFLGYWQEVTKGNLVETLQINPTIAGEGLSGATWKAMRSILLTFCGANNLVRVTEMRLNGDRMWTFLGSDRNAQNQWVPTFIPRAKDHRAQAFVISSIGMLNLHEYQGQAAPAIDGEPDLLQFVQNSRTYKAQTPEPEAKAFMNRMVQIENPRAFNTGTMDCISCHMAQSVRMWGERNYTGWNWSKEFSASQFFSGMNLQNTSYDAGKANHLRAFGYFEADAMFSQRVINETASVSSALSVAH